MIVLSHKMADNSERSDVASEVQKPGGSGSQHERPHAAPTTDQTRERLVKAAAAVKAGRAHPPSQNEPAVVTGEIPCEAKKERC